MDNPSITRADLDAAIAPLATKAQLDELRTDTRADLDAAIAPLATKAQLDELRTDLQNDLKTGLRELREFVVEAIHDAQTELLRGFEFYAKASEARLRRLEIHATNHDAHEAALNERMLIVESRIVEIEKKLLKP